MPSTDIRYSPLALQDLDNIWSYIALELKNPKAAQHTIGSILATVSRLSTFPDSGTPLSALYPIRTGYRYVSSGNYLAFYRHEGDVYVDRVLYAGSDYLKTLLGMRSVSD